jgi:peptidoglycan/LPS O-acetylase OafA/YrhL
MIVKPEARDVGLEFTRFLYIFMMVAYHCYESVRLLSQNGMININYYLGLVSGSFPFLAGFLVSYHYLHIIRPGSYSISARLLGRGTRLLAIYALINVVLVFWLYDFLGNALLPVSPHPWLSILYGESIYVAYDILVPIGLVLIIGSAGALLQARIGSRSKLPIQVLTGIGIAVTIATGHPGLASGLAGIVLGFRSTDAFMMNIFRVRLVWLSAALYGLIFAIMYSKAHVTLYVIGVLTLFYVARIGATMLPLHRPLVAREVGLFGKYSLLIYLFHVPIVVAWSRSFLGIPAGMPDTIRFLVVLAVILALSRIFVGLVDSLRRQYPTVNFTYRALFD